MSIFETEIETRRKHIRLLDSLTLLSRVSVATLLYVTSSYLPLFDASPLVPSSPSLLLICDPSQHERRIYCRLPCDTTPFTVSAYRDHVFCFGSAASHSQPSPWCNHLIPQSIPTFNTHTGMSVSSHTGHFPSSPTLLSHFRSSYFSYAKISLRLLAALPYTYWATATLLIERQRWGRAYIVWAVLWGAASIVLWAAFLPLT
ncbi:hypothetical protein EI94DRAFT_50566 [Lactarius quietus]|nr:hypothetical protein EI94DRAFT_50566 [Lactarius quietus]